MQAPRPISIQTTIHAPIEIIWECWTLPKHIPQWAFASNDWEANSIKNDVQVGGRFLTKMAAKDGGSGFDFSGVYTKIQQNELVEYDLDDGRHVSIEFKKSPQGIEITQTFDPDNEYPREYQASGWQGFLDNFKKYVESRV